jgi:hypothetical protein
MHFTMEEEVDNRINIIYIIIFKVDHKISFNICVYRKPTATDIIFPMTLAIPRTKASSNQVLNQPPLNILYERNKQKKGLWYLKTDIIQQ